MAVAQAQPGLTKHLHDEAQKILDAHLNGSARWLPGRSKRYPGKTFWVIPSSTEAGKAHYTTSYGCTCLGYRTWGHCRHARAVALFEARAPVKIAQGRSVEPAAAGETEDSSKAVQTVFETLERQQQGHGKVLRKKGIDPMTNPQYAARAARLEVLFQQLHPRPAPSAPALDRYKELFGDD